nr:MAG TPA: hypothetical protein [Caudoviricetes sp.]DAR18105.1 MAG TPA: hypothetical protein [Caudoviricetes sp.]
MSPLSTINYVQVHCSMSIWGCQYKFKYAIMFTSY